MLKMALFDCGITMKNVAALTENGAFTLFVRPHPGGFDSSGVPTPGNLPSKAKKLLMPGGEPGGCRAQVELTGALRKFAVAPVQKWCKRTFKSSVA